MTITDVQRQRKRNQRRSIYIDGEFAFGVGEETYVKFALFKGREVDEAFLEEVQQWDEVYYAKQTALNYVNVRLRSKKEVHDKLRDREYSEEAIKVAISFLFEYQLLDDGVFARAWVKDKLLKREVGRMKLESELRKKGVNKEVTAETLDEILGDNREEQEAFKAAEKKARKIRHDDPRKWDQSMSSFLANRGFGWAIVKKVLQKYRDDRENK